jgi:mycothiol synthase
VSLIVESPVSLSSQQIADIHRLAALAPGAADSPPLSESALIALRSAADSFHLLCLDGDKKLLGYAQLHNGTVELVTERGSEYVAADLVLTAESRTVGALLLWAHGRFSAARSFAERANWVVKRTLLQYRRTLDAVVPAENSADPATKIRTFRVGIDDAAWLHLNAIAFAHHPEQGSWTKTELTERLESDWFDPAGFLLAERAGELVGFHWTKVHADPPPIGEVYVLGVHPHAQGQHLGRRLLVAGIRHLQSVKVAGQPLTSVLLYVEGDNSAAVNMYEKAGFMPFAEDTQYARR